MLLGNDAVEGSDVRQIPDADRVFLVLKGHMRRLRAQFGIMPAEQRHDQHLAVSAEFQYELTRVWDQYLAVGETLATDNSAEAHRYVASLRSAVETVDAKSLTKDAMDVWNKERANLDASIVKLENAQDIEAMRTEFASLSQEIGTLARTFGFGEAGPIYELHCPMAFQGKGAVWYQASDEVRNPYFGSAMLTCADRVERIVHDEPMVDDKPAAPAEQDAHQSHSQH